MLLISRYALAYFYIKQTFSTLLSQTNKQNPKKTALRVKIMLLEDAVNGFCGLVRTARVHEVQLVKLMLMALFWKNVHPAQPRPSCKLIPRCTGNIGMWVLLSADSTLEKQNRPGLIHASYHFQLRFQEHNLMKYQFCSESICSVS